MGGHLAKVRVLGPKPLPRYLDDIMFAGHVHPLAYLNIPSTDEIPGAHGALTPIRSLWSGYERLRRTGYGGPCPRRVRRRLSSGSMVWSGLVSPGDVPDCGALATAATMVRRWRSTSKTVPASHPAGRRVEALWSSATHFILLCGRPCMTSELPHWSSLRSAGFPSGTCDALISLLN